MSAAKIKAKPVTDPAVRSIEAMDVINDRLSQAHATLDLILTLHCVPNHEAEPLCDETLKAAVYGAMRRIEEAKEAAELMHKTVLMHKAVAHG